MIFTKPQLFCLQMIHSVCRFMIRIFFCDSVTTSIKCYKWQIKRSKICQNGWIPTN